MGCQVADTLLSVQSCLTAGQSLLSLVSSPDLMMRSLSSKPSCSPWWHSDYSSSRVSVVGSWQWILMLTTKLTSDNSHSDR